ncbi:hypothetical protein GF374_03395 [Candidatus Woesearchaeota archaeon]|nr:hypothetical protein [Candidatus Woesearchaeota archaeon]
MPRKVDYPHCSFEDALHIARIVDKLGGSVHQGTIALELKMSEKGGGFKAKINGALKYGMLRKEGENIAVTDLADKYFHPIEEDDRKTALYKSFTSVPLYKELVQRFQGKKIEKGTLISLLIRTHNVNRNVASKVAWYFLKANSKYNFLEMNIQEKNDFEDVDEEESDEQETDLNNKQPIRQSKISFELFELSLHLGNLLYSKDSEDKADDIRIIKEILEKEKKKLSHSALFIDLLTDSNKIIIAKLKEALMKDLGIFVEEEKDEGGQE